MAGFGPGRNLVLIGASLYQVDCQTVSFFLRLERTLHSECNELVVDCAVAPTSVWD